uniref:Major facilitator superfamily (MFS) profile domain-containing protein n=1 Tax=Cuerna arida TaxID=1464854 RepID=A0A1B6F9B3_9HEMI
MSSSPQQAKVPVRQVSLIISAQFCERFCYYSMKAILPLFLLNHLRYSEQESKVIIHTYMMFVYFFPIIGSFLADNWFGKFNIIVYLSLLYSAGNFLLATASGLSEIDLPKLLAQIALFMIAFAAGSIKPCSVAFGGDQYIVPEQELLLKRYFSIYYFMSSTASFSSTFLSPNLVKYVSCYGRDSCYPLAFGLSGVLMILSFILFFVGNRLYIHKRPVSGENVIISVFRCIFNSIYNRITTTVRPKPSHFIDYADRDRFTEDFKSEVKAMLKVLVIFIAYPIFWALFDQKASSWIYLAKSMDRKVYDMEVLPEYMLLINSILLVLCIPLFEMVIYPLFAKCNLLTKPLERMIWGAITLWLAFVAASIIFVYIEQGVQLHVLWLLPQYFFVTLAEVLFSVAGIEFAYTDAPESMKSVIQAIWLLTSTVGNFVFIFITKTGLVRIGANESIFYTILMFFNIVLLVYLSNRYAKSKERAAQRYSAVAMEETALNNP